jgi:hypothetical protein
MWVERRDTQVRIALINVELPLSNSNVWIELPRSNWYDAIRLSSLPMQAENSKGYSVADCI